MFVPYPRMASPRPAVLARRIVLGLSALIAAWGVFHIGRSFVVDGKLRLGNPITAEPTADPSAELVTQPLSVRAEVSRVVGLTEVRPGDKCEFLVERVHAQTSVSCNAQVMCGGKLLYGGLDRGYFPCRFFEGDRRDVMGSDPGTTAQDKDAAIRIDTRTGLLKVWDDTSGIHGQFEVEAEVLSTQ